MSELETYRAYCKSLEEVKEAQAKVIACLKRELQFTNESIASERGGLEAIMDTQRKVIGLLKEQVESYKSQLEKSEAAGRGMLAIGYLTGKIESKV